MPLFKSITKIDKGLFEIRHNVGNYISKMFWASDLHLDNNKCNRKRLRGDLTKAVKENRMIILNGDTLCLMQGKYDPRSAKSALPKGYVGSGYYIDNVLNDAVEFLSPFAKNIAIIFKGNHETSVSNRMESCVLTRLVDRLNQRNNTNIQVGGYGGHVVHRFRSKGGNGQTFTEFYHHGNWGGIITKGTLGVTRYAAICPDADVCHSGHTHDQWIVPQARYRVKKNCIKVQKQWHIKTGTYKEEFEDMDGWAFEKIVMPKCIGGVYGEIGFTTNRGAKNMHFSATLTN